jgi:uncharacterized protein (DUF885 family)
MVKHIGSLYRSLSIFFDVRNEMHRAVRLVVDTGDSKDGPESKLFNFQWQMRPKGTGELLERYIIPGQNLSTKLAIENHGITTVK